MSMSQVCLGMILFVGAVLSGCSPTVSDSSICRSMGFYVSQTECGSATQSSCQLAQLQSQSTGKTVICWKQATSTPSTSPTPVPSPTPGSGGGGTNCTGQTVPWNIGAWSPAQCGPGVSSLSRSVTCNSSCPCNSPNPAPAAATTCTPDLSGGAHYASECQAQGGQVLILNPVSRICVFSSGSCPSGWNAYRTDSVAWTQTAIASAEDHINCLGGRRTVSTGFHMLGPVPIESVDYCNWRNCIKCKRTATVYASVTKVGCY